MDEVEQLKQEAFALKLYIDAQNAKMRELERGKIGAVLDRVAHDATIAAIHKCAETVTHFKAVMLAPPPESVREQAKAMPLEQVIDLVTEHITAAIAAELRKSVQHRCGYEHPENPRA